MSEQIYLKDLSDSTTSYTLVNLPKLTAAQAERLGERLGVELKKRGPFSASSIMIEITDLLSTKARAAFLQAVGETFGGTRVFGFVKKAQITVPVRIPWVTKAGTPITFSLASEIAAAHLTSAKWSKEERAPDGLMVIVPLGGYKVIDGETRTYSFQLYQETTKSDGNETSVEIYLTEEGGISSSLPIVGFSFKGGVKIAKKSYHRDESREGARATLTISKSFLVQKVKRYVRSFGLHYVDTEIGYIIKRKDGGDMIGPFWPVYNASTGRAFTEAARAQCEAAINDLVEAAARDLASRYAR